MVPVLRRNKATNSSTSTDPFSGATKTLVLGNLFKLVSPCKICHHICPGSLPLGIMKRIRRSSYFLHLYPKVANFPCECDVKTKTLNKLPSTRDFSAAEKWTVRSTGVGGFISPQNGNLRR